MEAIIRAAAAEASEIAKQSVMEKKLGCVIVDAKKRTIIAGSPNYTVGTLIGHGTDRLMHNVSMHSEMGAIESYAKTKGILQLLHRSLRGRGGGRPFEKEGRRQRKVRVGPRHIARRVPGPR